MGSWQDWLVTAIAAVAAVLVVWRTLGSWKDSRPSAKNAPACDHCAVADLAKEVQGSRSKVQGVNPEP
jgi:hypothetical protein